MGLAKIRFTEVTELLGFFLSLVQIRADEFQISVLQSFFVGRKLTDIRLYKNGKNAFDPDCFFINIVGFFWTNRATATV